MKTKEKGWRPDPVRKKTTIGRSVRSRPKSRQQKRNWKKYRGQGG